MGIFNRWDVQLVPLPHRGCLAEACRRLAAARRLRQLSPLSPQCPPVPAHDTRMFSALGELKSGTFRGRGARGYDAYNLGSPTRGVMSAALTRWQMAGGIPSRRFPGR